MSGIYIHSMKMPKACVYRENGHFLTCPLYDIDGYCGALNREAKHDLETKLCDCPLVSVPPHGRLIDADALREDWLENGENEYVYDTNAFLDSLDYAPTIIPASGEGE